VSMPMQGPAKGRCGSFSLSFSMHMALFNGRSECVCCKATAELRMLDQLALEAKGVGNAADQKVEA